MKNGKGLTALVALVLSGDAMAWGDRGHSLVTRVAVKLLEAKLERSPETVLPFRQKEGMLAHLSNIPDIYWRSLPKSQTRLGNPTHYFDLEVIAKRPRFEDVPTDYSKALALALKACRNPKTQYCPGPSFLGKDVHKMVGSAPWRVDQLYRQMMVSLGRLKPPTKKSSGASDHEGVSASDLADVTNQMLLYAGLMSHFVADLANPMHNTVDYDGWGSGQGGLHRYFETDVVNELGLSLASKVYNHARKHRPVIKKVLPLLPKGKREPLQLVIGLSLAAFERYGELRAIDKKVSLTKESVKESKDKKTKKIWAERKPPKDVKDAYETFAVEQLALGADVLSELWLSALKANGSPDFSDYRSYHYHLKPEFVEPDYLPNGI